MLLLVRHAMPLATEAAPSYSWALTAEAQTAARQMRAQLPADAFLISSCERKAWETVGGTGANVECDARFNEVIRTGEPWSGDFHRMRLLYIDGVRHPGWEPHDDAAARFQAGVVAVQDRYRNCPIAIGTHGMVLTNWLVSIGAVSTADATAFWSDLRFPDCIEVDTVNGSCRRYA